MKEVMTFLNEHSTQIGNLRIDWINAIYIFIVAWSFFGMKAHYKSRAYKELAKEKQVWRQLLLYCTERAVFCSLVAVLAAYLLLAILGGTPGMLTNYVLAPGMGIIAAFYVDGLFREKGWIGTKFPAILEGGKGESKEKTQPVSIVINNTSNEENDSRDHGDFHHLNKVSQDEVNEKGGAWYINYLHGNQKVLLDRLEKNEIEMKSQSETLEMLRQDRIGEKRIILEDLIYDCLNKGFATPAEDRTIRAKYHLYKDVLGGNGEVKELYESRYMHLGIHEDRRKRQEPFEDPDRRKED